MVLRLTHQVRAHVGRLGVNTTAHAGEESLQRGTHAEGQHDGGNLHELGDTLGLDKARIVENKIPSRNIQQAEAHHGKAEHGAGAERELKALVEAVLLIAASLGHTAGGIGSRLHADETGQTREEAAGQEGDGHNLVLQVVECHHGEDDGQDNEDESHYLVLLLQVGHGAFAHVAGDFFHAVCPFVRLLHAAVELCGKSKRHQGSCRNNPE